jgi:hypothetical protein
MKQIGTHSRQTNARMQNATAPVRAAVDDPPFISLNWRE